MRVCRGVSKMRQRRVFFSRPGEHPQHATRLARPASIHCQVTCRIPRAWATRTARPASSIRAGRHRTYQTAARARVRPAQTARGGRHRPCPPRVQPRSAGKQDLRRGPSAAKSLHPRPGLQPPLGCQPPAVCFAGIHANGARPRSAISNRSQRGVHRPVTPGRGPPSARPTQDIMRRSPATPAAQAFAIP